MTNPSPKPKRRYKRYSSEFKREALLRASEEGVTDKAVCEELGISTRQFQRWRDELALLGEVFYNRKLRHGYLGNTSPADFERQSGGSF